MSETPDWLTGLLAEHHHLPPMQTHGGYAENSCTCRAVLERPSMAGDWAEAATFHDAHVAAVIWAEITERGFVQLSELDAFDASRIIDELGADA